MGLFLSKPKTAEALALEIQAKENKINQCFRNILKEFYNPLYCKMDFKDPLQGTQKVNRSFHHGLIKDKSTNEYRFVMDYGMTKNGQGRITILFPFRQANTFEKDDKDNVLIPIEVIKRERRKPQPFYSGLFAEAKLKTPLNTNKNSQDQHIKEDSIFKGSIPLSIKKHMLSADTFCCELQNAVAAIPEVEELAENMLHRYGFYAIALMPGVLIYAFNAIFLASTILGPLVSFVGSAAIIASLAWVAYNFFLIGVHPPDETKIKRISFDELVKEEMIILENDSDFQYTTHFKPQLG